MTRFAAWWAVRLYRAYYATLRVRWLLPSGDLIRAADHPMRGQIFALAERDTVALGGLLPGHGFAVLVAYGRDGDLASALLAAAGCQVVRGSSRRGGAAALLKLTRMLSESDHPAAIVADGPLGPAGVAKPGAAWCALESGRPVRAIGAAARRTLTLPRTWSGLYVPLPFTTVVVAHETIEPAMAATRLAAEMDGRVTGGMARAQARARATLARRPPTTPWTRLVGRSIALTARVRDALLTALALPWLVPLWLLPWNAAAAFGRWYGYAAWAVMPETRRVGAINLRRAFGPRLTYRAARRGVREVFGSLGQGMAESIQFARRFKRSPAAARTLYECENPELERRILSDSRPRIFVIGHLGSWEMAASLAALQTDRKGAVVARRIDNPFLDHLWRRLRVREGAEWIDKRGAASDALARLRRGEDVAMLLDEHGGPRGVFVPFFGRLASTRKTPAVLSLATGAPVVVGACIRRPGHRFLFRLAVLEPDRRMAPAEAIGDLTARIVATHEAWIREAPWQWRWIHWRWKARPDGTEERYGRRELRKTFGHPSSDWPQEALTPQPAGTDRRQREA